MSTRLNNLMAGVFVIVMSAALIASVLWLGTGGPRKDYDRYLIYMDQSVSGLTRDSVVEYRGVDIGKVINIALAPNNPEQVELLLDIEQGSPIKEDTFAILEVNALTGIAYINLGGGSRDASTLTAKDGHPYPVIPSKPSQLQQLGNSLTEMIQVVTETADRLNAVLNDNNREAIEKTLSHLETLTARFERTADDVSVTMRNTRNASERLPTLLNTVENSARSMDQMANDISDVTQSLQRSLARSGSHIDTFTKEALPEVTALLESLHSSADNLREVSEKMATDPSILLFGSPAPSPGPGE